MRGVRSIGTIDGGGGLVIIIKNVSLMDMLNAT